MSVEGKREGWVSVFRGTEVNSDEKIRIPFLRFANRQETVNLNTESLQTQEREAVEVTLPISMHAGQIFLLTKLLTASGLRFYDFEDGAPVHRWRSGPSGSS